VVNKSSSGWCLAFQLAVAIRSGAVPRGSALPDRSDVQAPVVSRVLRRMGTQFDGSSARDAKQNLSETGEVERLGQHSSEE
jgi:hypothetical protein